MKLDAVILAAGPGSRMVELTRGRPKCLLPVGNHSLIWFAITSLKSIGVSRMIIIVPDIHEQDIKQYCHKKFNLHKDLHIEFATISMRDDCGTVESILLVQDKLRQDFIVYSCDAIVDPLALSALLNHYRLFDPMMSILLSDNNDYFKSRPVPGRREKEHYMRDVIAIEPLDELRLTAGYGFSANKIVFMHSERDLGRNLRIKDRELALHPSLEVCSRFLDTHIYIFKRQVIDFMIQNKSMTVLKSEMIPLLVSKQFSALEDQSIDDEDDGMRNNTKHSFDYEVELKERLEAFNPRNVVRYNFLQKPKLPRPTECHALISKDLVAYRVNTLGNYLDSNREAKNILNVVGAKNLNFIKGNTLVGEESKVGDKCIFKGGSIGNNCKIGDKVKLFGCVLMDNVEVESNVTLTDCIVGSNSRICSKCDLKSCIIGFKQVVLAGRKANGDLIVDDGYGIDLDDPMASESE